MDIIYPVGPTTARKVHEQLSDQPSYTTVRTILRILVEKGHLNRRREGKTDIYSPASSREKVAESALKRLLKTFYEGSASQVVSGLLGMDNSSIDPAELMKIEAIIKETKKSIKRK